MYRPEGWENPYKAENENTEFYGDFGLLRRDLFEAGADAMLKALRGQDHDDWLATEQGESRDGIWRFIPNDEVKDAI